MINIKSLYEYPLKSGAPNDHESVTITNTGLKYDRTWLLLDESLNLITSREFPELLTVHTTPGEGHWIFSQEENELVVNDLAGHVKEFQLFSDRVKGRFLSEKYASWFSEFLGIKVHLVYHDPGLVRPVREDRGGGANDQMAFADECPILLVGEGSLKDISEQVGEVMDVQRFRPNIFLEGTSAFEEDTWKMIRIGSCEFRVAQTCRRCVFTTIDPRTREKHPNGEPLRTLATYRSGIHAQGGVSFGVHLIPTKLGKLSIGDSVEVLE